MDGELIVLNSVASVHAGKRGRQFEIQKKIINIYSFFLILRLFFFFLEDVTAWCKKYLDTAFISKHLTIF